MSFAFQARLALRSFVCCEAVVEIDGYFVSVIFIDATLARTGSKWYSYIDVYRNWQ